MFEVSFSIPTSDRERTVDRITKSRSLPKNQESIFIAVNCVNEMFKCSSNSNLIYVVLAQLLYRHAVVSVLSRKGVLRILARLSDLTKSSE